MTGAALPLPDPRQLVAQSSWASSRPGLTAAAARWQRTLPARRREIEAEALDLARPRLWLDTIGSLASTGWKITTAAAPDAPVALLSAAAAAAGLPIAPPRGSRATVERAQRLVRAGGPAYVKLGLQAIRRAQSWHACRLGRGPLWESGVRIFCYHRIAVDRGDLYRGDLTVTPGDFRRQMELLQGYDTKVVPLADAVRLLADGPCGRFICLTFDDGYRDFEDEALPVLREAGFPATLFVTTGFASGTAHMSWYKRARPVLRWNDLERLAADELVELGAHTHTHPVLPQLSEREAREEIEGSRREIEERTGATVTAFAYPAGLYSARHRELVAAAGYSLAVTTDPGLNVRGTSRFSLRRMVVEGCDRASLFEAKLLGRLDAPWELVSLFRRRGARRRARELRLRLPPG